MALDKIPVPKNTLVVLRPDGRLYVVDFSERPQGGDANLIDWNLSVSKLIVGKVQAIRSRFITVEEIEMENVQVTDQPPSGSMTDFELTLFASLNGKDIDSTNVLSIAERTDEYAKAVCRHTAKNFSLQIRGTYNVNTVVFTYHQNGRR